MSESFAIAATLVAYKIVLLVIGVVASRRTRDAADFYLAGRRLGAWVASLSASASSSSAWSLLGVSGAAYAWGLGALWIFPACLLGFVINWVWIAPALRRTSADTGAITLTEVLAGPGEQGRAVRVLASSIIALSLLAYVASQFLGAGQTFAETFGWSLQTSVLVGAGIVVLYTLMGGFWAVSVTDTLQGLVMVGAAVTLPLVALLEVGGVEALWNGMRAIDEPGYADAFRGLTGPAAFGFVLGILGIGLGYPGQPHVVNRFMAMPDDATVARGRTIALGWAVLIYGGMLLVGWSARILLPELARAEDAFVALTQSSFPPVIAGVMLAAVLSAIMSTADSQLLVAASAFSHDLGHGGPGVGRARLVVLALSLGAVGAALWGDATIFERVLFAWTAMGAAFGPLLLVILSGRDVSTLGRFGAMSTGFVGAVVAYAIPQTHGTAWERVAPFVLAYLVARAGSRASS